MKQSLRVRAEGLRKAEELSVAVFLRFVGQSDLASWTLSREADAELVLKALDTASAGADTGSPDTVVWVTDQESALPGDGRPALRRPLQVEAFGALLRDREARLGVPSSLETPTASSKPAVNEAVRPRFDVHATHRLLRWPGNEVLQDQRHRKILASFLVSRPLSAMQLSSLSGIGQHSCIDFLQSLAQAGLLQTRTDALQSEHASATTGSIAALSAASTSLANPGGLIGRLRKRLGLL